MNGPAKILIRATNWIGDAVMSLPAIREVRNRFPQAHVALLARPWVAGLYARETSIDRVIPYNPDSGFRDLRAKWNAARALRKERFDLAILFQNAFEAAAVSKLAGIEQIIGYDRDGRGWLLSKAIPVPESGEIPAHESFYYLELLRRAGLIQSFPEPDAIRLEHIDDYARSGTRAFADLGIPTPVIGVSPGAAFGRAKRWLPERFAEAAADIASEHNASICLFGSASENALCEEVASRIPLKPVYSLAGKTELPAFIGLASACRVFLTNDSGAMHIASALGVPTVTVFGATNHMTTGPTGPLARIVREPVPCSPCLLRECPIDHRCMTGVSVARVTAAAEELLAISHK